MNIDYSKLHLSTKLTLQAQNHGSISFRKGSYEKLKLYVHEKAHHQFA